MGYISPRVGELSAEHKRGGDAAWSIGNSNRTRKSLIAAVTQANRDDTTAPQGFRATDF